MRGQQVNNPAFSRTGTLKKGLIKVTVPINEVKLTGRKIPIEDVKGGKKSKEIHQLQQMTIHLFPALN
jgi:hypothetical protein